MNQPGKPCEHAERFRAWWREMVGALGAAPDREAIRQWKLLLQDQYFGRRAIAPEEHQLAREPGTHLCLFDVYRDAYADLRRIELQLPPAASLAPE